MQVNGGISSTRARVTPQESVSYAASSDSTEVRATPVLGYTTGTGGAEVSRRELVYQAEMIAEECERRGLDLVEVVHDREPVSGKASNRPGLTYAFQRIRAGEAAGLVVAELSRLTHSVAELGKLIESLRCANARFVAVAQGLDTDADDRRLAANLLVEVSRWESERLSERTRSGLQAARRRGRAAGRPAVVDDPKLRMRIAQMRAQGMTLQAIADRLNAEGVPTVRGGAKWRHSSIQAAAGYRRPTQLIAGSSGASSAGPHGPATEPPTTGPAGGKASVAPVAPPTAARFGDDGKDERELGSAAAGGSIRGPGRCGADAAEPLLLARPFG